MVAVARAPATSGLRTGGGPLSKAHSIPSTSRFVPWFALPVVVAALSVSSLSGCISAKMLSDDLRARLGNIEREQRALREAIERQDRRIENLKRLTRRELAALRRDFARDSARLDEVDGAVRRAQGTLEALAYRLERLEKALGRTVAWIDRRFRAHLGDLPLELPKKPQDLLAMGRQRLERGRKREGRAILRYLVERHPADEAAAEARRLLAESLVAEGRKADAIAEYKKLYDAWRDEPKVALAALMRIGELLRDSGQCARAKQVFSLLERRAAQVDQDAGYGAKAAEALKKLPKPCK